MNQALTTMIARHWAGVFREEDAEAYRNHLQHDLFEALATIPGYVNASILERAVPEGLEFLIITHWESMAAIRQFAGDTPEVAVVPAHVQEMAVRFDETVRHYRVTFTTA